jgi:hypothetical protein
VEQKNLLNTLNELELNEEERDLCIEEYNKWEDSKAK